MKGGAEVSANVAAAGRRTRWQSIACSLAMLASSLVLVVAAPGPAAAGNDDLIDPDNVDHHIDRNSLTTNGDKAVARGIDQLDRSKMNATLSGSGDVEVYDAYYGDSGFWDNQEGYADCYDKTWTGLECDKWSVKFNDTNLGSVEDWQSCGCHEFGHTAGLSHRSAASDNYAESCMRDPAGVRRSLDNHDIAVINDDV